MKLLINFLRLILIVNLKVILGWKVNCDLKGGCYVEVTNSMTNENGTIVEMSSSVYLSIGYIPIIPEKNIIPIKNSTILPDEIWNVNQKPIGVSIKGKLFGSNIYECAGGVEECQMGCCKNGICSDPLNVCIMYNNDVRIIYIAVGFVFFIFMIFYWFFMIVLGIVYNTKMKALKSDNIYVKFVPKLNQEQSPNTNIENNNIVNEVDPNINNNLENNNFNQNEINYDDKKVNQQNPYGFYSSGRSDINLINNEDNLNNNLNNNLNHIDNKNFNPMEPIPEESFKSSIEVDNTRKRLGDTVLERKNIKNSYNDNIMTNKQIKEESFEEKVLVGDSNKISHENIIENEILKNNIDTLSGQFDDQIENVQMNIINLNNENKVNLKNEDKFNLVKNEEENKVPKKKENFFDWMMN